MVITHRYELITGQRIFPMGCTQQDMKDTLMGTQLFPHEKDPSLLRVAGKLRKTVQSMLSRDPLGRPSIQQVVAKFQMLANDTGCTLTTVSTVPCTLTTISITPTEAIRQLNDA